VLTCPVYFNVDEISGFCKVKNQKTFPCVPYIKIKISNLLAVLIDGELRCCFRYGRKSMGSDATRVRRVVVVVVARHWGH